MTKNIAIYHLLVKLVYKFQKIALKGAIFLYNVLVLNKKDTKSRNLLQTKQTALPHDRI
jgi:hypothetical protein